MTRTRPIRAISAPLTNPDLRDDDRSLAAARRRKAKAQDPSFWAKARDLLHRNQATDVGLRYQTHSERAAHALPQADNRRAASVLSELPRACRRWFNEACGRSEPHERSAPGG